eukprot:GHVS01004366.1.p1 GENE.GHVS01004366.1~~GHVS01004366.1.p1  ORF type:complete len:150 (+),score=19.47 GHVS01004366.1:77-526(+)
MSPPPLILQLLLSLWLFYFLLLSVTAHNNDEYTSSEDSIYNDDYVQDERGRFKLCVLSKRKAFTKMIMHPIFWMNMTFNCLDTDDKCMDHEFPYEGLSICGTRTKEITEELEYHWRNLVMNEFEYKMKGRKERCLAGLRRWFIELGVVK